MKNIFFTVLFFGFCSLLNAQDEPKVGDELVIEETSTQSYRYIKFPKLNILTKRGKVANYKSVYGDIVVVDDVIKKEDGTTYVLLKQKDGSQFFGYLNTVKANYQKSIKAGEISVVK